MSLRKKADALQKLKSVRHEMAVDCLHKEATALLPKLVEHQLKVATAYLGKELQAEGAQQRLVVELACEAAYVDPDRQNTEFRKALAFAMESTHPAVLAALRNAQAELPNLDAARKQLLRIMR